MTMLVSLLSTLLEMSVVKLRQRSSNSSGSLRNFLFFGRLIRVFQLLEFIL